MHLLAKIRALRYAPEWRILSIKPQQTEDLMCKASQYSQNDIDGKKGDRCDIGLSPHGLGALTPPGISAGQSIVCVRTGSQLAVSNVNPQVQRDYSIPREFMATFIQTGDDCDDTLRLQNGQEIPLSAIGEYYDAKVEVLYAAPRQERSPAEPVTTVEPALSNEAPESITAIG